MKIKQFIKKWNIAFTDWEEEQEFAAEMRRDINSIIKTKLMKALKIILLSVVIAGIFALGYFVAVWAAILATAFLASWIIFSEMYNQLF